MVNQQLQQVINYFPGYIFSKDLAGKFLTCNINFAHFIGAASPTDLLNQNDFSFNLRVYADYYYKYDRDAQKGYSVVVIEPTVNRFNQQLTVLTKKTPVFDDQNNIIGITGIFKILTSQNILRRPTKIHQREYIPENFSEIKDVSNCEKLSSRESQCLIYLLCGFDMSEVATQLNLSKRTVEGYIANLYSKLGCNNKKMLKEYLFDGDAIDLFF
ncbi:MAG: LuxR C-terminal-related transcriptional regulator [Pseudomonadota bacterium]